jgi:hypothetical protein
VLLKTDQFNGSFGSLEGLGTKMISPDSDRS